jgi:alkylation response protein AidB-like acyl-CoA dehydrogenase
MEAAKGLRPLLEAEADEAERIGHMTDKEVDAMKSAGLYHMLAPHAIGGGEISFVDSLRVIEQLAIADGSAGWCAMVGNVSAGEVGAYMDDKGIAEGFGGRSDVLISGQGVPSAKAVRADGGYLVSGDCSYASGVYHADLIHTGCLLLEDGNPVMKDGGPVGVVAHFTPDKMELKGNWDVIGLRGTGSYDYSFRDVFVPDHMCYFFGGDAPLRGGNQYTIGITGLTAWGHTGFALGVTRRALDEIALLARAKRTAYGLVADASGFQQSYAAAEASYRSARAFVYSAWDDACETLAQGAHASVEQIALIRLSMRQIHDVASEVCTFAYRAGGGVSLRESVLQRCYRDLHAGTQHILLSDQIMQDCGRALIGNYEDGARWHPLRLIG